MQKTTPELEAKSGILKEMLMTDSNQEQMFNKELETAIEFVCLEYFLWYECVCVIYLFHFAFILAFITFYCT